VELRTQPVDPVVSFTLLVHYPLFHSVCLNDVAIVFVWCACACVCVCVHFLLYFLSPVSRPDAAGVLIDCPASFSFVLYIYIYIYILCMNLNKWINGIYASPCSTETRRQWHVLLVYYELYVLVQAMKQVPFVWT
jgi:hypothetical protein